MAESKADILRRMKEEKYANAGKQSAKPEPKKPVSVEKLKGIVDGAAPKPKRKYTKRKPAQPK